MPHASDFDTRGQGKGYKATPRPPRYLTADNGLFRMTPYSEGGSRYITMMILDAFARNNE